MLLLRRRSRRARAVQVVTDDDDDLFAVRPKPARKPARRVEPVSETYKLPEPIATKPPQIIPNPIPGELIRQPSGRVASFSCVCGGQDEVREPAPATVQCWSCKPARIMKRWNPGYDTPHVSARVTTAEECARL